MYYSKSWTPCASSFAPHLNPMPQTQTSAGWTRMTLGKFCGRFKNPTRFYELADKLDLEFPIVADILRHEAKSQEEMLKNRLRDDE